MKKLLYILTLLAPSFYSCDNRDSVIENLNDAPSLEFYSPSGNSNERTDSVKISVKSPKRFSELELQLKDKDNNLSNLNYKIVQGGGDMFQDNQKLGGELKIPKEGTASLRYEPKQIGEHRINFETKDEFGEKAQLTYIVHAVNNLPPVALLQLNRIQVLSENEFELDASSSYDKDANIGGGISFYTFKINEKVIKTDQNKIKYIFPEPGNYNVSVTVTDTDGATTVYNEVVRI